MMKQCGRNVVKQQSSGCRFPKASYQPTQLYSVKPNPMSCEIRGKWVCKQINEPIYVAKLLYHPLVKDCPSTPLSYSDNNGYPSFESITLSDSTIPSSCSSSVTTI